MKNLKSLPKNSIIKLHREIEKAVKEKCYDCQCGHKKIDCFVESCPLYPLRPWANKQVRRSKQFPEAR